MSDVPKIDKDLSLLLPKKKLGWFGRTLLLGGTALASIGASQASTASLPNPTAIVSTPALLEKKLPAPLILRSVDAPQQIAAHSSHRSHSSHSSHSSHHSRSK